MTMKEAAIATNRFGLGARPGQLEEVAKDPKGWLLAQLEPERELPKPLTTLPSGAEDQLEFGRWLRSVQGEVGRATRQGGMDPETPPGVEASFVGRFLPRVEASIAARYTTAVETQRPFFERMVHFWSNHFVVSGAKPAVIAIPPSFEREAIRPHVMGKFSDLLFASTKHPGMLVYLDNFISIGPRSRRARRGAGRGFGGQRRPQGLNENLAREILELHTLGVDGGYTQADVTSFAKVITGWGVERAGFVRRRLFRTDGFEFDDAAHEPGPHTVLGKEYAQAGVGQGEAVLLDLARHTSTSEHVATKLVRHFVADDPPPPVVSRVAQAFRKSDGDLEVVYRALIESPEAWQAPQRKLKSPEEYLISAGRAIGTPVIPGRALLASMVQMGQRPYGAPSPAGWPDVENEWIGSDALWKRVQWAERAAEAVARMHPDPAALARQVLGPLASESTLAAIGAAKPPSRGLAILLASPEFQRR